MIPSCDPDSAPQLPLSAARPSDEAAYASAADTSNGSLANVSAASAIPSFEELELREYLREWRRQTAQEQRSPAYIILHDTTLDEICRRVPQSLADLRQITGIGERKLETFGQQIIEALARFQSGARATPLPPKKTLPAEETLRLLAEGRTFEDIAKIRSRQLTTVVNAVATLVESGQLDFDPSWIDATRQSIIEAACAQVGMDKLKNLKDSLPPEITYDEIRLVVARLRRGQKQSKATKPA
jgi:ATP-dependent DNA helicase RecQ